MSVKELAEESMINCLERWYLLYGLDRQSKETFEHFKAHFQTFKFGLHIFLT